MATGPPNQRDAIVLCTGQAGPPLAGRLSGAGKPKTVALTASISSKTIQAAGSESGR